MPNPTAFLALLLPLALLSCTAPTTQEPNPAPQVQATSIEIPATTTADELTELLTARGKPTIHPGLSLILNDTPLPLTPLPTDAVPVRLTITSAGKPTTLNAWLVSSTRTQTLCNEMHQLAILNLHKGKLFVSHPSGPGSAELHAPRAESEEAIAERNSTFALFNIDATSGKANAADLLRLLNTATKQFHFIAWPLADYVQ